MKEYIVHKLFYQTFIWAYLLSRLVLGAAEIRCNSPVLHEFFFPYIFINSTVQYFNACYAITLFIIHLFNSLSLFWLAGSVQWIFEISACDVITADYTIITSFFGNHVVYDRGAWFLRVNMSSSLALSCLLPVKKQFDQCIIKRLL